MKKTLMATLVVLLAACNDNNVKKVQSLPLLANDKTTLGEVLDQRPVCDKTLWTQTEAPEGDSHVRIEYQCVLSATQTQSLFSSQWVIWGESNRQRLVANEAVKTAARERKKRASPALLNMAYPVFEQLHASGDLARYKALVKDSPVHNQPLKRVNSFFASDEGKTYLTKTWGNEAPRARAALGAVTQAITATGLVTESQDIDVCTAPALLVLAVVLTPEEVEKGFNECRTSLTSRYEMELANANNQIAGARARLKTLNSRPLLVGVKEVITWSVPKNGAPTMSTHAFEMEVSDSKGGNIRRVSKTMDLADAEMTGLVSGDFNTLYQNALVSAMSELVR